MATETRTLRGEPFSARPVSEHMRILGGRELKGFVDIAGAKNSVLPCMAAVLLTDSSVHLGNVPVLEDVQTMRALLGALGVDIKEEKKSPKLSSAGLPSAELGGGNARRMLALRAGAGKAGEIPAHLVARMRASILVLGPLLARYGAARLALPGGCVLGKRPVDLHCWALERLGAEIQIEQNTIRARVPNRLQGCEIAFPFCSVGATQNALMASVLASGTTRLRNAAREPEIVDLVRVLTRMGARISGAGTSTLCIEGVAALSGARHCVIPDRLEAGSMILAAMATGGGLRLAPVVPAHLQPLLDILPALGGEFALEAWEAGGKEEAALTVRRTGNASPIGELQTAPWPGFPTDLQPQLLAVLCLVPGASRLAETVFENRFLCVPELRKMGAQIRIQGQKALISGGGELKGAGFLATDIRAAMALIIAALAAKGESQIYNLHFLDRGYESPEQKLAQCGARIRRVLAPETD